MEIENQITGIDNYKSPKSELWGEVLERVGTAATATAPPAPQPPVKPKIPIEILYSWPEPKVVQLSAGSREKNQRLLDPSTIAFRDDQVVLADDDSKTGVNVFFHKIFPEGAVMDKE